MQDLNRHTALLPRIGAWLLILALCASAAGCAGSSATPIPAALSASGFIEADEVDIAPEMSGRVTARPWDEGDEVKPGDVLLRIDDDLLKARSDLAQARLAEAQAALAHVKAGARQEAIARAEAQLDLARASRDGARQAWQDALIVRNNPQLLDVQIAAARAQALSAQKAYDAALLQRTIAEEAWKNYGRAVGQLADIPQPYRPALSPEFYLMPYRWEEVLSATDMAQASYKGAQSALDHLLVQRNNPQEAQAQVDAAYGRYQGAEAAVNQVQSLLDALRAGATAEQVSAAEAQVQVAQAEVESAQVALDKTLVRAPAGGVILATSVYTGEMAAPSVTALVLADLDHVTLTFYVAGGRLGQVQIGQAMDVRVDAFPGRVFTGTVTVVSDKAEYMPRDVRASDERVNMVYAVKIRVDNPDHALKPGVPAEVAVRKE